MWIPSPNQVTTFPEPVVCFVKWRQNCLKAGIKKKYSPKSQQLNLKTATSYMRSLSYETHLMEEKVFPMPEAEGKRTQLLLYCNKSSFLFFASKNHCSGYTTWSWSSCFTFKEVNVFQFPHAKNKGAGLNKLWKFFQVTFLCYCRIYF